MPKPKGKKDRKMYSKPARLHEFCSWNYFNNLPSWVHSGSGFVLAVCRVVRGLNIYCMHNFYIFSPLLISPAPFRCGPKKNGVNVVTFYLTKGEEALTNSPAVHWQTTANARPDATCLMCNLNTSIRRSDTDTAVLWYVVHRAAELKWNGMGDTSIMDTKFA